MVLWQSDPAIFGDPEKLNNTSQTIQKQCVKVQKRMVKIEFTHTVRKKFWLKKTEGENGIPVNDNTMVELANLCEYLKLDFASYFKGYELPKDSKFFSGNY